MGKTDTAPVYSEVSIVQLNLHIAIDMTGRFNLKAQADVLNKLNADVTTLNEVDKNCIRTGHSDMTGELGILTGSVYDDIAKELYPGTNRKYFNMLTDMLNQSKSPYADAIIIAPQCPSGQQWVDTPWADGNYDIDGILSDGTTIPSELSVDESNELECVVEFFRSYTRQLKTDSSRHYVMGLSMGGFATWDLLMRHGDMFAAGIPMCGGGDVTKAEYLSNIPIWTVHSSNDRTVPYAGTYEMAQAIYSFGGENLVFETKEMDHNVWEYVAISSEIADWLFSKTK